MPREIKVRPMYVSELEALEVVLSHSQMEDVYSDWLDRGEPDYHFWPYLRTLVDYLKHSKPDTPIGYPQVRVLVQPVERYDQQEILIDE